MFEDEKGEATKRFTVILYSKINSDNLNFYIISRYYKKIKRVLAAICPLYLPSFALEQASRQRISSGNLNICRKTEEK
jgi:hypothetical protein